MNTLHITVGAASRGEGLMLESEIRLLKAALLYGDKAKLCSLGASLIVVFAQAGTLNKQQQLEAMSRWSAALGPAGPGVQETLTIVKHLRNKRVRSKAELVALGKAEKQLSAAWEPLRDKIAEIVEGSGAGGLVDAYEEGLLEVEIYDMEDSDAMVKAFVNSVGGAVKSGDTFPLFDDATGDLVGAAIREGHLGVTGSATTRSKVTGLASDLLGRLPLFESATMRELLDIRRELDGSLVRFRGAIVTYGKQIESAQWDPDFGREADLVFHEKVAPAVADLVDAVNSNRLLSKLATKAMDPSPVGGTSLIGILVSKVAECSSLLGLSLGAAAGGAILGAKAIEEWREEQKEIERNQLYFYYCVGKEIEKRSYATLAR